MKYYVLLAFCLLPFLCFAQKESNIWYFGDKAAVSFNSGAPIALTNSQMTAFEGSASIADENGNLLLYTNGIEVWNRNHERMLSGYLEGDPDASQSAVIIKQPGGKDSFYVMTHDRNLLRYAIVDMKQEGGLGAVSFRSLPFTSNLTEGLAAVRHCNGKDVWILVQSYGINTLYAYLLTSEGIRIKSPVTSNSGIAPTAKFGYIRTTLQGDKIALSKNGVKEIYEFDNSTGKLGKHIVSITDVGYGFDFSPDGSKFYICEYANLLAQYDLSGNDSLAIKSSKFTFSFTSKGTSTISVAPDGKMYVTRYGYHEYLTVINKPNLKGAACDIQVDAVDLKGRRAVFGLPEFVRGWVRGQGTNFDFHISGACHDDTTRLIINKVQIDSIHWTVRDEANNIVFTSKEIMPSLVLQPGKTYEFSAIVFQSAHCGADTVKKIFTATSKIPPKSYDTLVCAGSHVRLSAAVEGATAYRWSTGSADSVLYAKEPGDYWVQVKRGNCVAFFAFKVAQAPSIWLELGQEHFICEDGDELVKLDAGKGYNHYLWYPTGDTSQWIIVGNTGEYYVIVQDFRGCSADAGTVVKRRCPGYLHFPTVFTPNDDKLNDLFIPVGQDIIDYELAIYNRWGELVFQTTNLEEGWNGAFKGAASPEGEYIWMSTYSLLDKDKVKRNNYRQGIINLSR